MNGITIHSSLSEWFASRSAAFEAVVLDVDGVLMIGGRAVEGSPRLIRLIRNSGRMIMLLTNDAQHSISEKGAKLRSIGVDVSDEEIVSCGDGLSELARQRRLRGERLFLMGSLGDPCFAELAGFEVTKDPEALPRCRGVVVGEGRYDWERTVNSSLNYFLSNPDGLLIVPNPDDCFPVGRERIRVGPGAIARFMQGILSSLGLSIEPVFLGKPHLPIFQAVHRRLEQKRGEPLDRSRVLMVGDLLESDVRGARDFGYCSGLVLSGVTNEAMLSRSNLLPDWVFEAL